MVMENHCKNVTQFVILSHFIKRVAMVEYKVLKHLFEYLKVLKTNPISMGMMLIGGKLTNAFTFKFKRP
jgi:glucose uptake protein GlcU